MSRIKLKKVDQISRKTVSDARDGFLRHCQLKNLAPHTYTYYKENLQFFFDSAPQVKFVDPHGDSSLTAHASPSPFLLKAFSASHCLQESLLWFYLRCSTPVVH